MSVSFTSQRFLSGTSLEKSIQVYSTPGHSTQEDQSGEPCKCRLSRVQGSGGVEGAGLGA